jgi:cobalamin synthase
LFWGPVSFFTAPQAGVVPLLVAAAAGLLAAEVLHRRATARLGGTSGDVMGAMGEVAATVHLLAAAALWP